uniref:Uncharacterized protein n=1 Tax=Timema shepardi TaxID=629360 RepID=A0A7R9AUG3_TIMSH|nr:unnamed protein product [Timema shepardi]
MAKKEMNIGYKSSRHWPEQVIYYNGRMVTCETSLHVKQTRLSQSGDERSSQQALPGESIVTGVKGREVSRRAQLLLLGPALCDAVRNLGDVVMTDLPEVMPLLQMNIDGNKALWTEQRGRAIAKVLKWGPMVGDLDIPSILLVADCVYYDQTGGRVRNSPSKRARNQKRAEAYRKRFAGNEEWRCEKAQERRLMAKRERRK